MRKFLLALSMLVLLTACGGESDESYSSGSSGSSYSDTYSEPTSDTYSLPYTPPVENLTDAEQYIVDIQNAGMSSVMEAQNQADVLALGYKVCEGLEKGLPASQMIYIMQNNNFTAADANNVINSALDNLC